MYKIFLFAAIMVSLNQALAAKFKGYGVNQSTKIMSLTESVDRFVETEKEFLILLSRHAAFYLFPKQAETSSEVRSYLKKLIKSKKRITIEIDPVSTEIKYLKD